MPKSSNCKTQTINRYLKKSVFVCTHLWLIFILASCRSKPTDLRSLAPADGLVYLETNDLGKTLVALTESKVFEELAENKTDFSAVENVQFAVVVTGFETSENKISDEQSDLNFKPHFVAIIETHRWKPTAVSIAENQIGRFVKDAYGDGAKLEKSEKPDAKFFVWTSGGDNKNEARKIFAAVSGGTIYVGNDEGLIDKCLAVRRGETESLLKNENLARAREATDAQNIENAAESGNAVSKKNPLAFGYVSGEGAAQIANLAAVSLAIDASEDEAARSFIARVLPPVLQKSVGEISWTARRSERGVEDRIFVATSDETSSIFKETMQTAPQTQTNSAEFLPPDVGSATRYNLQNPQMAWRGLLDAAVKQTDDAASASVLNAFSGELLGAYGISDAETFLSAIDSEILTAQFGDDGEKSIVIVTVKDAEKIKKSLAEINFKAAPEKSANAEIWKSEDGETSAALIGNRLIFGDAESVLKCLEAARGGRNFTQNQLFQKFNESRAVAVTFAKDTDSAEKIVSVLGKIKDEDKKVASVYLTETRFTGGGIERRTVSAFGLIGTVLEQIGE
ncbi:MAG: hypothetical protein H0U87_10110 [Acidobacteria bacterium]|nr:hypothetical protein [Acidobacteriota bacterium]